MVLGVFFPLGVSLQRYQQEKLNKLLSSVLHLNMMSLSLNHKISYLHNLHGQ